MTTLEYHVLLALANGALHGYAIKDAVASESSGTLTPRAGSLYRVIARLMASGWVAEREGPDHEEPHPGRPRRYYGLTSEGRQILAKEARKAASSAGWSE